MSQSLPWSVRGIDPRTRDAARHAARKAGMSVGEWLDAVIRESAVETDDDERHDARQDEFEDVAARLIRMGQGRTDAAPAGYPAGLTQDAAATLLERAAESERRAREANARTADVLDSISRWMERTETRLSATERSAAERQERAATVMADTLKTVGARLNEVERRSGAERRAYPELRSTPDRRAKAPAGPALSRATFADAVADIRARQRDLESNVRPFPRQPGAPAGEEPREGFARLRRESADPAQAFSRPMSRPDPQSADDAMEFVTRSLSRLEADVARLAAGRGAGGEAVERQLARLHERLDRMGQGPAPGDDRTMTALLRELGDVQAQLSTDLDARVAGLAARLDELKQTQVDRREVESLRDMLEDIRANAGAAPAPELTPVLRQIEALAQRIDRAPALSAEELDRRIGQVMQRLDQLAPGAGRDDAALMQRIEALALKLDDLSGRAPSAVEKRLEELVATLEKTAARTSPGLERQIEALAARIEQLAASNGLTQVLGADGKPLYADLRPIEGMIRNLQEQVAQFPKQADHGAAITSLDRKLTTLIERPAAQASAAPDLKPIEELLRSLPALIEKAQAPGAGAEALGAIERQIASLAARVEEQGPSGPVHADPVLERTLRDLISTVSSLHNEVAVQVERATRNAVAESLDDLRTQQSESERRVGTGLVAVRDAVENVASRLKQVEDRLATAPRPAPESPAPVAPPKAAEIEAPLPPNPVPAKEPALRELLLKKPLDKETLAVEPPPARIEPVLGAPRRPEAEAVEPPRPQAAPSPTVAARPDALSAAIKGEEALARKEAAFDKTGDAPGAAFSTGADLIDRPLEPGHGMPRAPQPVRPEPSGDQQTMKANYIAAARRAVRAAAAEAQASGADAGGKAASRGKKPSKPLLEGKKKPVLLGLAAALFLAGPGYVISTSLFGEAKAPQKAKLAATVEETAPSESSDKPAALPGETNRTAAETKSSGKSVETAAMPEPAKADAARETASILAPPAGQASSKASEPVAANSFSPATAVAATPPAAVAIPAAEQGAAQKVTGLPELPATIASPGLRKAVMEGDPRAVYDLAARLAEGRGMPRDPKLAMKLFERAAATGLAPAQLNLGIIYEKGIGTARDIGLARLWYERAAEQGNAKAMHNLAVFHAEGATGKTDYPLAAEWFRKAADFGVRDSQYNLAMLLGRGLGVAQDLSQSYAWFAIAAAQGDDEAVKKRDEVGLKLSQADLASARKTVEAWKPQPLTQSANEVPLPAKGWDSPTASPAGPAKKLRAARS